MGRFLKFVALALALGSQANSFPAYGSLAGLSYEEIDTLIQKYGEAPPENPPGPPADTSVKLVNDAAHPYQPPGPHDIRGPCPALNTLASHGYLPRNGIATPAQIINAVQDGFNFPNSFAKFVTYAGFLVDGNPITNLMSIGRKSKRTGRDPPKPAIVGGLNTHNVFEGDTSMSRADFYFGDNHSFNQTVWDEFIDFSNRFGEGKYNLTVAGELRFQRIQDSIATNPQFSFVAPRYITAYIEAVVTIAFFIDGRQTDGQLDLDTAVSFFRDMKFPDGFFRANGSLNLGWVQEIAAAHPVQPGANQGIVNTYTPDPHSADLSDFCKFYVNFVNDTIGSLYPNPKGVLRTALNRNLDFLYEAIKDLFGCPQVFPYGK